MNPTYLEVCQDENEILRQELEWKRYHLKVREDENQSLRKLVERLRADIVDMRRYK